MRAVRSRRPAPGPNDVQFDKSVMGVVPGWVPRAYLAVWLPGCAPQGSRGGLAAQIPSQAAHEDVHKPKGGRAKPFVIRANPPCMLLRRVNSWPRTPANQRFTCCRPGLAARFSEQCPRRPATRSAVFEIECRGGSAEGRVGAWRSGVPVGPCTTG